MMSEDNEQTGAIEGADFRELQPGLMIGEPILTNAARALEAAVTITVAVINAGRLQGDGVADFLKAIHGAALTAIEGAPDAAPEPVIEFDKPTPAQIRKSITPDALTSFIDGKPYKTLKRHLTKHGLTIETYRERYGLPQDYPSTAASYSAQRSALAKQLGLGQREAPETV